DPEDFAELLRRMLSGEGPDDMPDLSALNIDPAMLNQMMGKLKGAFSGDAWESALRQALHIANKDGKALEQSTTAALSASFSLANLWLSEATTISELGEEPQSMTRG